LWPRAISEELNLQYFSDTELEMTETKDPGDHKPDGPFSNSVCAWDEYPILEVRFEPSNPWER